uniref:LysM domain-containing protein n=1 Tax=Magnetococcus massalia (strain MO-1) TaxID=451514 RepID=A0A1S7LM14_MAGMO|nr:putative protein involved in bacterial cell wall degradation. Containing LysM domain [Candidatus Magnetococcus massalia]
MSSQTNLTRLLLPLLLALLSGCISEVPHIDLGRGAPPPPKPEQAPVRVAKGPALAWSMPSLNRGVAIQAKRYTVKSGDTLWAIAMAHSVDMVDLARWNKIDDPDKLYVGRAIFVSSPTLPLPAVAQQKALSSAPEPSPQQQGWSEASTPTFNIPTAPVTSLPEPQGGFNKAQSFIIPAPHKGKQTRPEPKPRNRPDKQTTAPRQVVQKAPAAKLKKAANHQGPVVSRATAAANLKVVKRSRAPRRWKWPVRGKVIARFGRNGAKVNAGIDIAARSGTAINAPASGVVSYVGDHASYGNLIILRHGGDFKTLYAHNQVNLVSKGQRIKKGQIIARVGNTGRVRSPRLHFELRKPIKPLNPLKYLSK